MKVTQFNEDGHVTQVQYYDDFCTISYMSDDEKREVR